MKDYRYYLRMWAKEKEPKTETIKDLPRMNQVTCLSVSDLSLSVPDLSLSVSDLSVSLCRSSSLTFVRLCTTCSVRSLSSSSSITP